MSNNHARVSEFVSLGYTECSVGQVLTEGRGLLIKVGCVLMLELQQSQLKTQSDCSVSLLFLAHQSNHVEL